MCKHTSHTKDILCPVCAKNKIYDLKRELAIKNLVIYFLEIDVDFIFDFDNRIDELKEKVYEAVKYRNVELDHAFFKAIGRLRRLLYKMNINTNKYSKKIQDYLGLLDCLESTYSIEKSA